MKPRPFTSTFLLALASVALATPAWAADAPRAPRIEAIRVTGNGETQEYVIRRELTQKVGDPLDRGRMDEDLARLYKLNYFDRVWYDETPGSAPGSEVLNVEVKEKQTWMVFPAVAWTSKDGPILSLNFKKDNLLGRSQSVGANINLAHNYYYYFTYDNPWIDAAKTSLDSTLYVQRVFNNFATAPSQTPGLIIANQGLEAFFGRPLGDVVTSRWKGALWLKAERTTLQNFNEAPVTGPGILASGGDADLQVEAGYKATFDSRDVDLTPTKGWLNAFSIEQFVPGIGASNFTRLKADVTRYVPLGYGSLALGVRGGTMFSVSGGMLPSYERFFPVSENLVRGWPENPSAAELQGFAGGSSSGDSFALASAEYRIPIWWIVGAATFADTGLFWDQALRNFSWDRARSGYGAGLRINMPALGPLRIDYGLREWSLGSGYLQLAIGNKF